MVAAPEPATKAELRAAILAARRDLPQAVRDAEARRLCDHLPEVVRSRATTVCAYLPVGTEPGSAELVARLDTLCETVLLPVVAGDHAPLLWGRYTPGSLVPGRFGLREPAPPRLPPEAVARAGLILVPALAVDRHGVRLGRGGGFYDRSLPLRTPGTPVVAVVRECEVVAALPRDAHDVRMTHALTPDHGLIAL